MEWCSDSNPRKKFKKDETKENMEVELKSLLRLFIEYAWDKRDGQLSGCEDVDLIDWLASVNINVYNEFWETSIELNIRTEPRIQLTEIIKTDEEIVRVASNYNKNIICAELAYNLRRVLPMLINCEANINYTDNDGRTILHVFLEGYLEMRELLPEEQLSRMKNLVKQLMSSGASLYMFDNSGKSPLHFATMCKNKQILQVIISCLTDVNECDDEGNTALHIVVDNCVNEEIAEHKNGYVDIVETLVFRGADFNIKNKIGATPVHLAAEKFYVQVLKFFLDNGADLKKRSNEDKTPLHYACKSSLRLKDPSKMVEMFDFLVSQGCEIEAVDERGYMPLHYAVEFATSVMVESLIELGANVNCRTREMHFTPLYLASKADRLDNMVSLKRAKAVVNAEAADGSTALFMAARMGSFESMEYLIDRGADLYRRDKLRGFTLLHFATNEVADVNSDNSKKLNLLIKKDFHVNDPGFCGITPLMMATVSHNVDAVKILIKRGANVNFQTSKSSLTALHLATMVKDSKIVKILIDKGADVNCRGDITQMTPLHMALSKDVESKVKNWHDKSVITDNYKSLSFLANLLPSLKNDDSPCFHDGSPLLLIDKGVNVNAKDSYGQTPLHLATLISCNRPAKTLLRVGAYVNVQDFSGRLPLHNLLQNSYIRGLELLLYFGADINDDDTSELAMSCREDIKETVIKHAIKLKVIGLPIAKLYEPYVSEPKFQIFYKQCEDQKKKLMDYREDCYNVSFYEFFRMGSKRQFHFSPKIMDSYENIKVFFSLYVNMIPSLCRESVIRYELLALARIAWSKIAPVHLPDVCVENILSHLNNRYLEFFADIAENDEDMYDEATITKI